MYFLNFSANFLTAVRQRSTVLDVTNMMFVVACNNCIEQFARCLQRCESNRCKQTLFGNGSLRCSVKVFIKETVNPPFS